VKEETESTETEHKETKGNTSLKEALMRLKDKKEVGKKVAKSDTTPRKEVREKGKVSGSGRKAARDSSSSDDEESTSRRGKAKEKAGFYT
jgi:hypothetical protein